MDVACLGIKCKLSRDKRPFPSFLRSASSATTSVLLNSDCVSGSWVNSSLCMFCLLIVRLCVIFIIFNAKPVCNIFGEKINRLLGAYQPPQNHPVIHSASPVPITRIRNIGSIEANILENIRRNIMQIFTRQVYGRTRNMSVRSARKKMWEKI